MLEIVDDEVVDVVDLVEGVLLELVDDDVVDVVDLAEGIVLELVDDEVVDVVDLVEDAVKRHEQAEESLDSGYVETYVGRGCFGGGRV